MIAYWSSIVALLIAIVGCGYLLAAAVLVGRFARAQTSGTPATTPTVTILKPLYGDDAAPALCTIDYGDGSGPLPGTVDGTTP